MNLMALGSYGLIGWGLYRLLLKKSPVSTQATPVLSSVIAPTVSQQTSASVAAIQARLNTLGANPPLVVDGISGPKTIEAIKAFQSANGITPDGIVGPITQAALDRGGAAIIQQPTTYVQPNAFIPTPINTSASTGVVETVHTWDDEPEQSLVDHF